MPERIEVSSGTAWEELAGYSRGVRVGDRILTAGTTASGPDGLVGGADPAAQADYILDKIDATLQKLDSSLADVVRIRVFVSDIGHWEPVARVLGKRFTQNRPVSTLVEAKLISPEMLVEIEAEAIMDSATVQETRHL